jgi:hypothetical protein
MSLVLNHQLRRTQFSKSNVVPDNGLQLIDVRARLFDDLGEQREVTADLITQDFRAPGIRLGTLKIGDSIHKGIIPTPIGQCDFRQDRRQGAGVRTFGL